MSGLFGSELPHAGPTGSVGTVVRFLWITAGTAMAVFVLFLAVLLIAALLFRLGSPSFRRHPRPVFAVAVVVALGFAAGLLVPFAPDKGTAYAVGEGTGAIPARVVDGVATGAGLPGAGARSLVLYNPAPPTEQAAELNATMLANLVSHFGSWSAQPVSTYRAGQLGDYDATFYLGDPGGPAIPTTFLDDVLRATRPVVWIGGDLGRLQARAGAGWTSRFGFATQGLDTTPTTGLRYKDAALPVDPGGSVTRVSIGTPARAAVLASAVHADGSTLPWAVRSGALTYLAENPLLAGSHVEGRNLTFADLLAGVLNPSAATRHRALVRLEDVNPTTDPAQLRAIVDYLSGQKVPFSVGVYTVFRDPAGVGGQGDLTVRLSDRPELIAALADAVQRGGALVLHGYTHQYGTKSNPSDGRSGDDAEFYLCHLDAQQQLRLDGPVAEDSAAWALGRFDQSLAALHAAALPRPQMIEFPHYMASAADYAAAAQRFSFRYERSLYFPGLLSGHPIDSTQPGWQFFPYAVRDVYGTEVIPENLDYVRPDGDVAGMLATARQQLVVRDGVASFFYHPFLGVGSLPKLIDGLRSMGYTFVAAPSVAGAR